MRLIEAQPEEVYFCSPQRDDVEEQVFKVGSDTALSNLMSLPIMGCTLDDLRGSPPT